MVRPPKDILSAPAWFRWLLHTLPSARLHHSDAVWRKGAEQARLTTLPNLFPLACLLHDVGRALDPKDSSLHTALGANFLRQIGMPEWVTLLVAQHSGARFEAHLRQLEGQLAPFPYQPGIDVDLLSYLDGTTSPEGETVTLEERLVDIISRYGEQSWQAKAFTLTLPEMRRCEEMMLPVTGQYRRQG